MQSLITVHQDAELRIVFTKDAGAGGSLAIWVQWPEGQGSELREFEIGPFDTNLDLVNWLLRQLRDLRVLRFA